MYVLSGTRVPNLLLPVVVIPGGYIPGYSQSGYSGGGPHFEKCALNKERLIFFHKYEFACKKASSNRATR